MICLRCAELSSEYQVLRTYGDLAKFRKALDRRERAFELLQARLPEIEKRLHEQWYWLSEHSRHRQAAVTACVRLQGDRGKLEKYVRRFNTMTADLRALAAW
jgi:hypothetical protein